ncbi:MAG: DUF411 domain-containing protein [Patescibacteria group bacterium]|nr:DUF411 domain-containing protein [Patescibacteria group bacterium]
MSNKVLIGATVAIAAVAVLLAVNSTGTPDSQANQPIVGEEVVVYKDPSCGCCGAYVSYLKSKGVAVNVQSVTDIDLVKDQLGVPHNLMSCHTAEVGGYVVEGHVPLEVIGKLLAERPEIKGIALPGMPSGAPGMPGPKTAPFTIYTIGGAEGEIYTSI